MSLKNPPHSPLLSKKKQKTELQVQKPGKRFRWIGFFGNPVQYWLVAYSANLNGKKVCGGNFFDIDTAGGSLPY